mmetsp:Transcript_6629/g.11691  ORF Transcript_6629/g.11691 Transcript_6629/m.11691 type:complete len:138 (+) Transcript_6629:1054-1467(+)
MARRDATFADRVRLDHEDLLLCFLPLLGVVEAAVSSAASLLILLWTDCDPRSWTDRLWAEASPLVVRLRLSRVLEMERRAALESRPKPLLRRLCLLEDDVWDCPPLVLALRPLWPLRADCRSSSTSTSIPSSSESEQ